MPPPCSIASTLGQVFASGVPGSGCVYQRHCSAPVSGIVRFDVAGDVEVVAADADDDVVVDDERRGRGVVELIEIADLGAPFLLARPVVERQQMAVGRLDIDRRAEHGDAAVADVPSAARRPGGVPQLASAARVERPDVIGNRHVQDAVDDDRRALDDRRRRAAAAGRSRGGDAMRPAERQRSDVAAVDRRQRAEPPARVVAVVHRPRIRRRREQRRRRHDALAVERRRRMRRRRAGWRRVSFERPQIGDHVVDGFVGVLVEQLVVHRERIADLDLHARHAREGAVVADASRSDTLKLSMRTSVPETGGPDSGVTVTSTASCFARAREKDALLQRQRIGRTRAQAAKSPVGEWHVLHCPAPLK